MNPTLLSLGFKSARSLWSKFNDTREEKMRKAYDELEQAASNTADAVEDSDVFPRTRKQAGRVTQAAHNRLERAIAELSARRDDASERLDEELDNARKEGSKLFKRGRKAAKKRTKAERKRAEALRKAAKRKLGKEESSKFWPILGIISLIAAIGTGVYYFFLRNVIEKEEPATKPPRVEEFSSDAEDVESSRLIYTSTSEQSGSYESTPEQAPKERDEQLLDALDEQIAKLREEKQEDN